MERRTAFVIFKVSIGAVLEQKFKQSRVGQVFKFEIGSGSIDPVQDLPQGLVKPRLTVCADNVRVSTVLDEQCHRPAVPVLRSYQNRRYSVQIYCVRIFAVLKEKLECEHIGMGCGGVQDTQSGCMFADTARRAQVE